MKRIIYSCFLFISLILICETSSAQIATITPISFCYNPAGVTGTASVSGGPPATASYTWAFVSPSTSITVPGQTVIPGGLPGSQIQFTLSGCGVYQLNVVAVDAGSGVVGNTAATASITCPNAATITASTPSVCQGSSATLTALGAATWTWSNGANGSPLTVTPSVTTVYTATGTTAGGCTVQAAAPVTVVVQPISMTLTPATQTVCNGTTLTLSPTYNGVTNYQWRNVTTATNLGNLPTQTVVPLGVSVYSVLGTSGGCSVSATTSITVGPNLSLLLSSNPSSACPTQGYTLTAVSIATTYTWITSLTGFSVSGATQSTLGAIFSGTNPITYTVNGSTSAGCTGTNSITIFPQTFTPTLISSSPSVCPGETFTLTSTGGAANSYSWAVLLPTFFPLNIFGAPNTQTAQINVASVIITSVTSILGCTGLNTVAVGITPNVVVTAVPSSSFVCATTPVTLTANGAASYTWVASTGGTIAPVGSSVVVVNPAVATTYSVFGTNAAGFCGNFTTVTVGMTAGGTLNFTASANASVICAGAQPTLTANGLGAFSYSWTPSLSLSSPTGSAVVASPNVNTVYTVSATNGGGCTGSQTVGITISPVPTLFPINASASAICAGFTSTLTASGIGASSYEWNGSTILTPILQPSISVSPGTYTVIGFSAIANCPSNPVSITITLAPPLNITTSQTSGTTCINENRPIKRSAPVNLVASGGGVYTWFPYNPAYMTFSVGPTTTVRPPASTCYTVTGSTSICSGSAIVCVTVIPQYSFNVVPPSPVMCIGDTMQLTITNISTLALGPPSSFAYEWLELNNSSTQLLTLDSYTSTVVNAFPLTTSIYTVEMSDSRLCKSFPRLVTLTVLPQPLTAVAIPTINSVPTNTVCFVGDFPGATDNLITLTAFNTNIGLPFGVVPTYTWVTPYQASFVTDPFNAAVITKVPARLPALAIFTVLAGYNGIAGCKGFDTVTVRAIDCRPISSNSVAFNTDINRGDTICARTCVTFFALTDTVAGGPQTYTWTFDRGAPATSTLVNPTVCYNSPGQFSVKLVVSNPYPIGVGSAGIKTAFQYIRVVDVPNVTIVPPGQRGSDTIIRFGQPTVLTGTNALFYNWSPNYNITSIKSRTVTVNPFQTTQYILTGYNSRNCFSSDTINVIVIPDCGDMFVPNAFSPNGDGINDELKVRGACLETLTFLIFNRWGEKVFETSDINKGWDGTFNGDKMNTGVFVYRLEGKTYEGKGFSAKGNITLIR
jgi:gliding motility-associated-like protein